MLNYKKVNDQHIVEIAEQIKRLRSSQAESRKSLDDLMSEFRDILTNLDGDNWFMGDLAVRTRPTDTTSIKKFYQELQERGIESEVLDQCLEASKVSSYRIYIEPRSAANHPAEGNGRDTSDMSHRSVTVSSNTSTELSTDSSQLCPRCNAPMVIRRNQSQDTKFWGCSKYPACTETRSLPIDRQTNSVKFKVETVPGPIPTITDRQEFKDTTVDRDTEVRTLISELPIGQQITNPLFERYQRVLSIDDVFVIPDEEFISIPNFDHEALSILRMQVCAFMYSEDLWDRTMIPVSVPDLSGDSQDYGDSFFQKSFLPYNPANEAREEEDEYGEDEEEEDGEDEGEEDEEYEDEEDEDVSRKLEARGSYIGTTSYDYHGDLGDDEGAE